MGRTADSIRVLHVDDERSFGELTAKFLTSEDDRLEVVSVTSVRAGLDVLDTERVDCVVSDYEMPRASGLVFLERVRERNEDVPFIMLTGRSGDGIAGEAAAAGVTDYLRKTGDLGQYAALAERIAEAVAAHRDGARTEQWGR
jgi:DNA-binding NtrC family response regulator